jgi:hypothetical protein
MSFGVNDFNLAEYPDVDKTIKDLKHRIKSDTYRFEFYGNNGHIFWKHYHKNLVEGPNKVKQYEQDKTLLEKPTSEYIRRSVMEPSPTINAKDIINIESHIAKVSDSAPVRVLKGLRWYQEEPNGDWHETKFAINPIPNHWLVKGFRADAYKSDDAKDPFKGKSRRRVVDVNEVEKENLELKKKLEELEKLTKQKPKV